MGIRNGASTRFRYDFGGRTVGIEHALNGSPLLQLQFLYDALGNMRVKHERADEFQLSRGYSFDALHRLTQVAQDDQAVLANVGAIAPHSAPLPADIPNGQQLIDALITPISPVRTRYELDLTGNRTKVDEGGAETDLRTNVLDQYVEVDGTALRYDANGNLIDDGQIEYRYDYRNQLTSARRKSDGALLVSFVYDAAGRKIADTSGGPTRQWIYLSINPLEEYENGHLRSSNILDAGVDSYLQICRGGKDLYLATDLVRSTRFVLNDAQKEGVFVYDDFGRVTAPRGGLPDNLFLFQGKRWLPQLGKYDFFTRLYDPAFGRFQQRDGKGFVDGTNLYSFAGNNPLSTVDPFGMESRPETAAQNGIDGFRAANTPLDVPGAPLKGQYDQQLAGADRAISNDEDEWRWDDNPIWNTVTHNGISFATALLEEGQRTAYNFDRFMRPFSNWATFGKTGITRFVGGKGWDALLRVDDWIRAPANRLPWLLSNRGFASWLPMSRANAFLAPLGVLSNSMALRDALFSSDKTVPERIADGTFSALGLFSSGVGTTALLGSGTGGLLMQGTRFLGPAGLVTGAAAGGYAIGQLLDEKLGWHESLAARANRNRDLYRDTGLSDTAATILGMPANIPILSEVGEGLGWGAYKVYQGGSYVVGGVANFVESRDWGKTFTPWRW